MVLGPPGTTSDEPRIRFETVPATMGFESGIAIGDQGVALTMLRPSGKARFSDQVVDVVSEGPFISANSQLEIVFLNGNRIVVREV